MYSDVESSWLYCMMYWANDTSSVPQIFHLENEGNNSTHFRGLLEGLNQFLYITYLEKCPGSGKGSVNVIHYNCCCCYLRMGKLFY